MYKQDSPELETYDINSGEEKNELLQSVSIAVDDYLSTDLVQHFKATFYIASLNKKILAAYKARKQCYKICKDKKMDPNFYKTCVDAILLNEFPKDYKKAQLGKDYAIRRNWLIVCSVVAAASLSAMVYMFWDGDWDEIFPFTIPFIGFSIAIYFLAKKLKTLSASIKKIQ